MKLVKYLMLGLVCTGNILGQEKPADSTLDEMLVTGLPLDETVLPTVRPVSSALGTDANVLDTPRSVSTITAAQLEARQIHDVNSLGQYSAGTYSPSIFGAQGVPYIRGILAEIYQNGERLPFYRNSFPPSFNSVEALDVVKGPGSSVFGASSNAVGGYVNFVTKQPNMALPMYEMSLKISGIVPSGHTELLTDWGLDISLPIIKDKLAIRVSYEGREGDGYYQNTKDDLQDIFLAVTYLPNDSLSFEYTAQFYESRFNENVGYNRVTQDLIDNGNYISGPIVPSYAPYVGYVNPGADGSYKDQTVKLKPWQTLTGASDSAYGKRFLTQLVTTYKINDDWSVVDHALFGTLESRKQSAYGYSEYNPGNSTFDTRLQLQGKFSLFGSSKTVSKPDGNSKDGKKLADEIITTPGIENNIVIGASYRIEDAENYSNFDNEPFAAYDLANGQKPNLPLNTVLARPSSGAGDTGVRYIPGGGGYSAGSFAVETKSQLQQVGLFLQDDIKVTSWLSFIGGFRLDFLDANARRPALGTYLDGTGGTLPEGPRNSHSDTNQQYFYSMVIKPKEWLTVYATYNKTNGVNQNQFGGLQNNFTGQDLKDASELYETGIKVSGFDNTVYASIAGFYQTRVDHDIRNNPLSIQARGIEIETTYQPNRNFNASANMTFLNEDQVNANGNYVYSQTGSYLDTFTSAFTDVNGGKGTSKGSPNYAGYFNPNTRINYPGQPSFLFNAYATYTFDCGFGISVGPQVTGEIPLNADGSLIIPAQVTWNAALFYKKKNWLAQIDINNFTNEKNWTPTDPFASNDLIYPNEPLNMDFIIKYKF